MALRYRCPLIGINDSGGARIQEGVVSLAGYADIFFRNVQASGVVPQISLVMGPCAGGAVYSPVMTDFVMMVEETSHMFITGPEVVKTVTGEEVTFEDLGGARTHATRSGVAHLTSPDEKSLIEDCRYLLSFLPQSNEQGPPWEPPSDPPGRESEELDRLIPDEATRPYDMHERDPAGGGRRRVLRDPRALGREPDLRVRPAGRPQRRDRGQPAAGPCGRARHRQLDQGRPLRAHLRRVQHPGGHLRRRPRVPAGHRPGVAAGSSATGRSCCTPTARRPCPS